MLDPRSPYSRRMWHYESDRPLSVAQLIALGSVDARTAALLWLLIERHQSVIVSGPTDPTPGIGKTTTLNALLDFLPGGSTLVYTTGMYEDFAFRDEVEPAATTVLANEVSNHLRIYMWGRVARELLALPEAGFAVATSCHADTVEDVLDMLCGDLRLPSDQVSRLGIIVNIGLVGRVWPPRRRFLTVNLLLPETGGAGPASAPVSRKGAVPRAGIRMVPLAEWEAKTDTQRGASVEDLAAVAALLGMPQNEMHAALERRQVCLEELAAGQGVGRRAFREAVAQLQAAETQADDATRHQAGGASESAGDKGATGTDDATRQKR